MSSEHAWLNHVETAAAWAACTCPSRQILTYPSAQDIAAARAHKTISGADVLKALESLQFGELVTMFQGELEGNLIFFTLYLQSHILIAIAVFRQGNKNKSKVSVDAKGKGRDSPIGIRSAVTQSSTSGVSAILHAEELRGPEVTLNGASVVDVEMQDASGIDNLEVKVTPIE